MTAHRPTRAGRLLFIERWRRAVQPASDPAVHAAPDHGKGRSLPGCQVQPSPQGPAVGDAHDLARTCLGEALTAVLGVMADARASPTTQVAAARLVLSHGCGRPAAAPPPAAFDAAADFARILRDADSLARQRPNAR
jgi:hypothetical protein